METLIIPLVIKSENVIFLNTSLTIMILKMNGMEIIISIFTEEKELLNDLLYCTGLLVEKKWITEPRDAES